MHVILPQDGADFWDGGIWPGARPVSAPRVSVLLTTRDGAATLPATLVSLQRQSLQDFELVVVDDGSRDATQQLLAACPDPRLRVLRHAKPRGIASARNAGLALCRAPYVAMHDHDDLSAPDRLRAQMAFLDRHPEVTFVGTAIRLRYDCADRRARVVRSDQPLRTTPALLRFLLHVDNPLTWSSVMLRAAALRGFDSPLRAQAEPADDYDLYHRLLSEGGVPARLDQPLVTYRWHAGNASHATGARIETRAASVLARAYAPWFGAEAGARATLVIRHLSGRQPVADANTRDLLHETVAEVAARLGADRRYAARICWRLTRAAVRGGRPDLFRRPAPMLDGSVSLAVGTLRALR